MPDAGGHEPGTHDRGKDPRGANPGWAEAFAALPQDGPDAGGWQRVQARLPAQAAPSRVRWPLWLATAASLVLAVAIPLRMLPRAEPDAGAPVVPVASAPTATQSVAPPPIAIRLAPESTAVAQRGTPRIATGVAPSPRPTRIVAPPVEAPRVATVDAPAATDLDPLYAQSAQLESLLALARDDRVASGTSAALSDGLDTELANIDATLIQPGLADTRRADLWRQRVDALQQLVGIETTNRLYAARGQHYDAALVSID